MKVEVVRLKKLGTFISRWDFLFQGILFFIILSVKSIGVLCSLYPEGTGIGSNSVRIILPILLLVSISYLFAGRGRTFYLLILDTLLSVLFLVDMVYARAYGHLISVYMLFAKDVMGDMSASALSITKWTDFLMLIDLPFIFAAVRKTKKKRLSVKKRIPFAVIAVLCAVSLSMQFSEFDKSNMVSDIKFYPLLLSPIGNHLYDVRGYINEKADKVDGRELGEAESWLRDNSKYQQPAETYKGLRGLIKGKNVIAIHVESLENFVVNRSFYGKEITPNINKILKNGIYFSHIHEQVKDGNSSDCELMVNASVYPLSAGSAFLRFGGNKYVTLPSLLKEEGYKTLAIHGDDKVFWNRSRVYPMLGYDRFIDEKMFEDKSSCGMGVLDSSLFSQTIKEIKRTEEPYFMSLITITSHMPFNLDKDLRMLNLPDNGVTNGYLECIRYVDEAIGQFYERLNSEGLLKDTVIVIYGDHEGIHKYYSTTLPNNSKEIPFAVIIPGFKGFVVDKTGGQIDMMPTLAYLLGIDENKYETAVMGRNLFSSAPGTAVLSDGAILGEADDTEHLKEAQKVSDIIIKGDYFERESRAVS